MSDRCIPADQLRVRRGVGVNVVGQDGEVPTAVLDLLLARGANRPHHPLADRAVLVGDIGQQELHRVGPEAVPLDDRANHRLRALRQLAEQRHALGQTLRAPLAAVILTDIKLHRNIVANYELYQFPHSAAGSHRRYVYCVYVGPYQRGGKR